MTTIFDVVQAMSGQKNVIVIPVPYLDFFKGDQQAHALSAILNQLVFWSGVSSSADDGWFYKSHEELAEEIHGLSGEEQARRLVDKLRKKYFPGVIETKTKKVNGTPVTHYKIDGNKLISMIFPSISETSKMRNGNVETAESERRNCGMETAEMQNHGNVESEESYLYTDLNSDKNLQITKDLSSQNSGESSDQPKNDFLTRYPEAVIYSANFQKWGSADDLKCAQWLFARKCEVFEDMGLQAPKDPNFTEWANDIRLMSTIDGRSHKEICQLYKRITQDDFWKKNIQCPQKLREQWDNVTLRLAGEEKITIDAVERDETFRLIFSTGWKPKNKIQELSAIQARKNGLGRMSDVAGLSAWRGIWKQVAEQVAQEAQQ
ncbi:replication protein 15 [Proteus terrae]|uniref:replication protein 15 n=1 Tax=Proteus terrae TaxID=1574161 RepID=UPI001E4D58D4|nr:replication protein 15 [Proteus terrae]